MRLLVVTQTVNKNDTNLGFFHEWLKLLSEQVDALTVIALSVGEYSLPQNVRVLSLGKEKGVSRLAYLKNFWSFLWKMRNEYDTVLVHMNPEYIVLAGWWWRLTHKRIFLWYVHKSVTWKLQLAKYFVKKIFTASVESCRVTSSKIVIVGHGVDTRHFTIQSQSYPPLSNGVRLLMVGRIAASKDMRTVVRALKHLEGAGGRFQLDVVGEPILPSDRFYLDDMKHLIKLDHMEGVVRFLGGISYQELPQIYATHHALVHASNTGSIDKVVLEAMACGLPVVSSSEAYASWNTIIHFPEQNDQALAAALGQTEFVLSAVARQKIVADFSLELLIKRLVSEM